jgi:DNA-binding FrmR family transcriptional regulator
MPNTPATRNSVSKPPLSEADRRTLIARLRRAEGQVRAVARQVEEAHDCEAIAQQLTAARRALDRSFYALVGCALQHGQIEPDEVSALLAKYA